MDEVSDAFKFVLGEEFINEMIERLKIIGLAVGILLIVIIIVSIWTAIMKRKYVKALNAMSEIPDNEHADCFIATVRRIGPVGRFIVKINSSIKTDSRSVYNSSVAISDMDSDKKQLVKETLMSVGCMGLLNK